MVFNSLTFLLFLAVVLLLHSLPLPWRVKKLQLLLASYLFYAAWNPPFVALLVFSTGVDWFVAGALGRAEAPARRRALVVVSLAANLGLLGFFKYAGFGLESFVALASLLGVEFQPAKPDIFLPIGISFYTFQTLSYTLDVYRRDMRPWTSFLDYALYVSFFPQLVAGPIVRARHFLPQCLEPRRASGRQLGWGLALIAIGLFEKIVLADTILAPVADRVYAAPLAAGFATAWTGTVAFAAQIFCDFSGYSTCAIGVGLCLGFELPDNFRSPYGAVGISDYWRRWHISLSTWLRDYLYVSLGGNRAGGARTYANVMLTMLIGGLWHGASWNMCIWGGIHGLLLTAERPFRLHFASREHSPGPAATFVGVLLTFATVCLAFVMFRAETFAGALALWQAMLTGAAGSLRLPSDQAVPALFVAAALVVGQFCLRNSNLEAVVERLAWPVRAGFVAVILIALVLTPAEDRALIYFQF
jgi:D-alanyl-lipoteichoic acid acyltransferase DltB (MBOAT superfamily)